MTTTFTNTATTTFHVVSCYSCRCPFGITDVMYKKVVLRKDGSVFCPACGKQTQWIGKTEEQKLRDQLVLERALHDQTRSAKRTLEKRLIATRGVVTRTKNRIKHGVCPCCNRTFENVAKHMQSKHPEYVGGDAQ